MIAGNHIDRTAKLSQDIGRLLNEHAVHAIILEGIPSYEDELGVGIPGSLHHTARGGQAFIAHTLADRPHMDGLHADLPVCGVEEFHCIF